MLLKKLLALAAFGCLSLNLTACETAFGGNTYGKEDVGRTADIRYGTLISFEEVKVQGNSEKIGIVAGAATGAVIGSQIGGDKEDKAMAGAAGAIAGGAAGAAVEHKMRGQVAFRYTINMDSNDDGLITVVQADKTPLAQPGQRVRVEYGYHVKVLPAF